MAVALPGLDPLAALRWPEALHEAVILIAKGEDPEALEAQLSNFARMIGQDPI